MKNKKGKNFHQTVTVDASSIRRKLHETSDDFLVPLFFLSACHFAKQSHLGTRETLETAIEETFRFGKCTIFSYGLYWKFGELKTIACSIWIGIWRLPITKKMKWLCSLWNLRKRFVIFGFTGTTEQYRLTKDAFSLQILRFIIIRNK